MWFYIVTGVVMYFTIANHITDKQFQKQLRAEENYLRNTNPVEIDLFNK